MIDALRSARAASAGALAMLLVAGSGCSDPRGDEGPAASAASTAGAGGAGGSGAGAGGTGGAGGGGCTIADCAYPPLALWQEPIADYVEAASKEIDPAKLRTAIDDLIVADDKLFRGYGDATENAGRVVPIEVRYWQTPDDAAPQAEAVVTDEEAIARCRRIGVAGGVHLPSAPARARARRAPAPRRPRPRRASRTAAGRRRRLGGSRSTREGERVEKRVEAALP